MTASPQEPWTPGEGSRPPFGAPSERKAIEPEWFALDRMAKVATWSAALLWVAFGVARVLVPGLAGSSSGIGELIQFAESHVATFATQLALMASMAAFGLLSIAAASATEIGAGYRSLLLPLAVAHSTIVLSASQVELTPAWSFGQAIATSALALLGVWPAVKQRRTRALGLVLLLGCVAGALYAIATSLAFAASIEARDSLFGTARLLATLGTTFELVLLFVAFAWWLAGHRYPLALAAVTCVCLAGFTWYAAAGSEVNASPVQIVALHALTGLLGTPAPYFPLSSRHAVETFAFALSLMLLLKRGHARGTQTALALAVLSGARLDVPLCAQMLALASVLAVLEATLGEERPKLPLRNSVG